MKNDMDLESIRLERITRNLLELARYSAQVQQRDQNKNSAINTGGAALKQVAETSTTASEGTVERRDPAMAITRAATGKPRAAVVAWDLSHNPAGRALVLYQLLEKDYEVDLIGPVWSRFGKDLWQPLRGLGLNVRQFRCTDFMDFVPKAELAANAKIYDIVYVCKPRLPSIFIGKLISLNSVCPMIVDVDDFELSFFKNETYADYSEMLQDPWEALKEPYEELATRYSQTLIDDSDAVTVSNLALKRRFGGSMVRHARDETGFRFSAELRERGRRRLGIADDAFVLLFVGTPRPHKGVLDVARAVYQINDPSIVFHVVGTISDRRFRDALSEFDCDQVVYHPNCDFSALPEILAAADLVPLIQDVEHPISQYQIPAKVSDATSMGIPVLATRTPPLEDLILTGGVIETTRQSLQRDILACKCSMVGGDKPTVRGFFTGELGMDVNRARLSQIIDGIDQSRPRDDAGMLQMVNLVRHTYAAQRGREIYLESISQSDIADNSFSVHESARGVGESRKFGFLPTAAKHRIIHGQSGQPFGIEWVKNQLTSARFRAGSKSFGGQYDIAFFWKQNDSRIYGRRSDMVAKYLAKSGRVRSLVHFDAPISHNVVQQRIDEADQAANQHSLSQQQLIVRNLYDRQLGLFDTANRSDRTYVNVDDPRSQLPVGSMEVRDKNYSDYVKRVLAEHGMAPETTIAWFCPVVWEAPTLIDNVGFAAVISDLIDDQRAWATRNASFSKKLDSNYENTLSKSDLVFANCDSLAHAFVDNASHIHVVPNGAECLVNVAKPVGSRFTFPTDKPVVGYVGNLRDRIDWILLHEVVAALPGYQFVFMGPSSDSENAMALAQHPNVSMLGVVPYDEMVGYLGEIDVAIVPHLKNHLTARMNPLKVYNYFAAGLPVVSTDVANLEEFGSLLVRANTASEFVESLRRAVANPVDTHSTEWRQSMHKISWVERVNTIIDVMDSALGEVYFSIADGQQNTSVKSVNY